MMTKLFVTMQAANCSGVMRVKQLTRSLQLLLLTTIRLTCAGHQEQCSTLL